jgi:hypothetical protein
MRVALNEALKSCLGQSRHSRVRIDSQRKYSKQDRQENVMQKMHGAANNRSRIQITPHQGSMHAPEMARGIQSASQMEEASSADHQLRTDAGYSRCLFRAGACRRQCHN